jgi:class 3 adenylate cyclase/DNA-binding SARP family transcriptional activator
MNSDKSLPKGTVTLLFADIEGSTRLLGSLGKKYATLLSEMRHIVRECFNNWNGVEVGTEGDSFFAVFPRAVDSVNSAVSIQRRFSSHKWPNSAIVKIRIGLHTGEPWVEKEGYVGMDVHRAARISNIGHGGQILLSETTAALVRDEVPNGIKMINLGWFRLKDFQKPENIRQLVIPDLPSDFPPLKSPQKNFIGSNRDFSTIPSAQNQDRIYFNRPELPSDEIIISSNSFSKSQLQIHSLGGLSFRKGTELIEDFSSEKVKALLIYLIYNQKKYPREHLAKLFWENRDLSGALSNLDLVLRNLDNTINECMDITTEKVAINDHSKIWLDVFEFENLLEKESIAEALVLYHGDFLAGLIVRGSKGFQDWVSLNRDRLHQLAQEKYDKYFDQCKSDKDLEHCMDITAKMLVINPLNERNHRRMMFLKVRLGQVDEALHQYETLSNLLKNELGKEPSLESHTLYTKIRDKNTNLRDFTLI